MSQNDNYTIGNVTKENENPINSKTNYTTNKLHKKKSFLNQNLLIKNEEMNEVNNNKSENNKICGEKK